MALIYSALTSLDGYVADADGDFSWAAPDEEVHGFVNDLERPVSTYLYGRGMYDVMAYWESAGVADDDEPVIRDYARIWRAADKVVYSTTLTSVASERTRIESEFVPKDVRELIDGAGGDVSVGGPHLAAAALRAGLVDRIRALVVPYVAGGGTSFLPEDVRLRLRLVDERRFTGGVVFLHYEVCRDATRRDAPRW